MSQYSCKWNSHAPHLLGSMDNLRGVENFVDVTLVSAGGRQLKAHRLVLSTCSEMLHEMFLQHTQQHIVVVLADVPYPTLKQIVDFAYRGEVSFPEGELEPLLKAANALQITALSDVCREKWMAQAVDTENPDGALPTQVSPKRSKRRKRSRRSSVETSSEDEETPPQAEKNTVDVIMEVEVDPEPQSLQTAKESTVVVARSAETQVIKTEKDDLQIQISGQLSSKQALRDLCHTRQIKVKSLKDLGEPQDRRRSYVWNFFTPVDSVHATCKACGKNISRKSSISNLKKHLENKHGKIIMDTYSSELIAPAFRKEKDESENQNETEEATDTIANETTVIYEGNDQLFYVPTTESEPAQNMQSMPIILKLG